VDTGERAVPIATTRVWTRNRHLASRLIHSQEVERQRIGRELHDDLSQELALLNFDLEHIINDATSSDARSRLQEISKRARHIAAYVRDLSHVLHPFRLRTLGLIDATQSLCRDVAERTGVDISFVHGEMQSAAFDPNVSLCLYRIAQEALSNIAKHSHATEAWVHLELERRNVSLSISDAGVGFDTHILASEGLGLISMHERVCLLKGQFEIESSPGKGTRIQVRIPMTTHPMSN
jgi:signal transduction histidine kinase